MKKIILRIAICLLALVLLVSGYFFIKQYLGYVREKKLYTDAQTSFTAPAKLVRHVPVAEPESDSEEPPLEEEAEEETLTVDFDALKSVNGDIIAWLYIPGTEISYPVLRGTSNDSYIHTAYDGSYAAAGSIFMDYRNSPDLSDANTVIYGHNMKNDTMFGSLSEYRSQDYYSGHSVFEYITPEGKYVYTVFAALVTDALSSVYDFNFSSPEAFSEHISMLRRYSVYNTGVEPNGENIMTLSTCTRRNRTERFVIAGQFTEFIPNETEE
jgi:sortase B